MKLLLAVFLAVCLTGAQCRYTSPEGSDEPVYESRSLTSALSNLVTLVTNGSLQTSILTAAGAAADVALTSALTPVGAAIAKQGIGYLGLKIVNGSDFLESALANSSLANSTLAQLLLNRTEQIGALLSAYGGGEQVEAAIELAAKVASGNITIQEALLQAGCALADDALVDTKASLTAAGKSLEAAGGIVEKIGDTMSALGNTTATGTLDNIETVLSKFGADKVLNATCNLVNKALNISVDDIVSEKLAEIDSSSATLREKVVAVGQVLDKVGVALEAIADTAEELGSSSVADYPSIIKEALTTISV